MNDHYLCRGRTKNGVWLIGVPIERNNEIILICWGTEDEIPIIPETLGWCTALRDCAKKLVFEGDIFEAYDMDTNQFLVEWDENDLAFIARSLVIDPGEIFPLGEFPSSEIGVTGNAYENPELLQEVQNGAAWESDFVERNGG